ncbi:asparagine--tRNA ligase [Candidatus Micrarchaeota archaeon]|nr:asparagine--tRNA ligase [Candidatus Micrarchaeota archaeon]
MKTIEIAEVLEGKHEGKKVKIRGWIYRTRSSGGLAFVVVRDSSGIIQCAVKKNAVHEKHFEDATKALIESAVIVSGTVKKDDRAPTGFELQADSFEVIHFSEVFPISKDQSTEFLLDVRHLWIRSQELNAVMKIKATTLKAFREFFDKKKYYEVTPPIITSSAAEGGSTLFEFNYFGKKAYLSQSAQLHLEALIFSLEKVYAITPSFRAEKSRTIKHLTEYWHIEGEEAHLSFTELQEFLEEMISFVCQKVASTNEKELKLLGRDAGELKKIKAPFPKLTYAEALEKLSKKGRKLKYGDDFGVEEELLLTEDLDVPLFITNWPKEIKAFYMKESKDGKTVHGVDILAPKGFGEIVGGSERETDVNILISKLKHEGADLKEYEWYLDLRRFGSVQHSGFGLGTERFVRWICGLEHIRDTTPFPRVINRAYP